MKFFLLLFVIPLFSLKSQSISECQARFNTYLNFHQSLNQRVQFNEHSICFFDQQGNKEWVIYEEEIETLSNFLITATLGAQKQLLLKKGLTAFSKKLLDSLNNTRPKTFQGEKIASEPDSYRAKLNGVRIAIEAGHFGTNLKEAKAEQKYLYFPNTLSSQVGDSIKLFESALTFNTAKLLETMLTEQGAVVMLSRSQANYTSFECTYSDWMTRHKKRVLDSLFTIGNITASEFAKLKKSNNEKFFWDFFRDFELGNRAKKINAFQPQVTLIIHYNVDEKNTGWKKPSSKNFTMAFIGGGFTSNDLNSFENKLHFLRLLLSKQLNQSETLAALTAKQFNSQLNIPIAKVQDATYLNDKCLKTKSEGVFCRNLALCRKINSLLVYGESLYQDNEQECQELMKLDLEIKGIKTNKRLLAVANSYFEALMVYWVKPH